MQDYDLSKATRRARGTEVVLPGIEESAGGKAAYLKALRALIRELARYARNARDRFTLQQLAQVAQGLVMTSESTVARILDLEAQRHTTTFISTVKRAIGIDVSQVVRQEDLGDYLQLAAQRNASLIKSLSSDTVKRVEQAVLDNLVNGNSQETLRKTLVKEFDIADSRAKLIASDQMGKLNSDMNRIRHEQAGISEYIWTTSRDERVRPLHRSLDGKKYRYGQPTGAEGGLQPGQPIRCRCIAKAVVQF